MAEEKKKLTTAEILAQARAQAQGKTSESPSAETPAAPAESAPATPETPAPAAPAPPSAPKSTSDILAAARAQAGGKPSAPAPQKPTAGGAAKSTSDILAAARAQAGKGAAAPAAGDSPAPAKAKPKAAVAASGELPPVQEMIKAVTGDKPPVAAPAGPQRMPIPQKPPVPKAKAEEVPRRNVLLALVATPLALAWTLLAATTGWFLLYTARFMMPNYLIEPPSKFKIGPPSDYGFGTVSTKWTSQFGVWIVHTEYNGKKEIYALASVCTHLGCTPNWLEGEQKFKCPCHGSGFYINGINFEGPAPRPLERVGLRLGVDGLLEVDKSVKFQEELGQWNDDTSFVVV